VTILEEINMKKLILAAIFLFFVIPCQAKILYVDVNTPDNNDGLSWAKAYKYLQDALANADSDSNVNEIRVAEGIYKPDEDTDHPHGTGDREATFQLKSGVAIYGGYSGFGKPNVNFRDVNDNETILSGDLDNNDDGLTNNGENSIHVVTGNTTGEKTVIDGFTICHGNADIGSSTNPHARGGGIYISTGEHIVIDCTLKNNAASYFGAAICVSTVSSEILNCRIFDNGVFNTPGSTAGRGGGIAATGGMPIIE
jgi:hypothetical protein